MYNNQTIEKLIKMRLPVMAITYQHQTENNMMENLSFDERLANLVDTEWQARQNNRLRRLIKKSEMKDQQACLENINYNPRRKINK